ncbi:Unknown protein [Striga hermonthica]|uniref:Uncharacterized protein n=1 Tax=Striga hermonthica TaxID=68872 RepID=A0A9N7RID8_STRHE|nr:Unknown protein [Striga hermonthica]
MFCIEIATQSFQSFLSTLSPYQVNSPLNGRGFWLAWASWGCPARISFSSDLLDESNFISICPNQHYNLEPENVKQARVPDNFEFLSSGSSLTDMMSADELFREGKLLPFWQAEKLDKITLKTAEPEEDTKSGDDERRISWFLDDDPSPRPPKCTVLWKELLRLKKQRPSTLSPSSSSSSSSSSYSSGADERRKGGSSKEKVVSRVKKGLERTRSASIRIRPMVNVPIYTHTSRNNASALPPLFPVRKGRLD